MLRGELVQANHLRKEQLVELGLLREEENQKMKREHETEVRQVYHVHHFFIHMLDDVVCTLA